MLASSMAGVLTAIGALVTAVSLIINAVAAWRRDRRIEGKVDVVHTIVNQQRTDAMNYQRALISALNKAGIEVPEDQSAEQGH